MWILERDGWHRLVWVFMIYTSGFWGFCNDLAVKPPKSFWPLRIRKPPRKFDLILHESEITEDTLASEICPKLFAVCVDPEGDFDWPRFGETRTGAPNVAWSVTAKQKCAELHPNKT